MNDDFSALLLGSALSSAGRDLARPNPGLVVS